MYIQVRAVLRGQGEEEVDFPFRYRISSSVTTAAASQHHVLMHSSVWQQVFISVVLLTSYLQGI